MPGPSSLSQKPEKPAQASNGERRIQGDEVDRSRPNVRSTSSGRSSSHEDVAVDIACRREWTRHADRFIPRIRRQRGDSRQIHQRLRAQRQQRVGQASRSGQRARAAANDEAPPSPQPVSAASCSETDRTCLCC
ncbi:MAG: hypothetical protein R2873_33400 [Caldilineaceae bacterium]